MSLPSCPLSTQSTIVRALAGRDWAVQFVKNEEVEAAPADLATKLDRLLLAQPIEEPTLTLKQEREC